ncbi:hypothetical protein SGPA1_30648 [Streptomyces misionensis JCM 4497]
MSGATQVPEGTDWRSTPLLALMYVSQRATAPWRIPGEVRSMQTRRSSVAQLAEQPAVNRQVTGSSPVGGASVLRSSIGRAAGC